MLFSAFAKAMDVGLYCLFFRLGIKSGAVGYFTVASNVCRARHFLMLVFATL